MRLVILLALVAVALIPASAHAVSYAGERDAHPLVHELTAMAVDFWQARDVQPCAPIRVMQAPSLLDLDGIYPDGRGSQETCTLWTVGQDVRDAARERWRRGAGGDSARDFLCMVVFHEVGHLGGLGHAGDGLMSGDGITAMPYECTRWRRRLERAERAAAIARARSQRLARRYAVWMHGGSETR
jgi:hypothetical protein